ncbi:unnamed protein product [Paramecium octaurelia]|uniref:Uncharacterized protein n=1 Tax=Paramecium octaurelia TaxID=43137 RepID=A0A8S1U2H4_PAROT|nr:unnamed protein product [Paramecium octaurelia]
MHAFIKMTLCNTDKVMDIGEQNNLNIFDHCMMKWNLIILIGFILKEGQIRIQEKKPSKKIVIINCVGRFIIGIQVQLDL